MVDRQLLRTNSSSASVVGLIPESIYESQKAGESVSRSSGGIDGVSGLAYLISPTTTSSSDGANRKTAKLQIWKNRVCTLSEDLIHGTNLSEVIHPEYEYNYPESVEPAATIQHHDLIALAPFTPSYSGPSTSSSVGLYWCSPSGVLCFWNDIVHIESKNHPHLAAEIPSAECSASLRLPLANDEYVTCLRWSTSHKSNVMPNAVLIGTSKNQTWMCLKNTRPLELQARLLNSDGINDENDGGNDSSSGLLGGIYSRIFTPSKSRSASSLRSSVGGDGGADLDGVGLLQSSRNGGIISILPLTSSQNRNKPSKSLKLVNMDSSPNQKNPNNMTTFYTVSRNGIIDTWILEYDHTEKMHKEQKIHSLHICSSLRASKVIKENVDGILDGMQVLTVEMDDVASCIILAIKVMLKTSSNHESSSDSSRLYILHCPIKASNGRVNVGKLAWLSRYSSDFILSDRKPLECVGIMARTDGNEKEQMDDNGVVEDDETVITTTVYSAWQQGKLGQEEDVEGDSYPVTVSAVRFVSSSNVNGNVFENTAIQNRDIDLPCDAIPSVFKGTVGYDTTTDGCVMVSTTGCIVNTRIIFPFLTHGSINSISSPRRHQQQQQQPQAKQELIQVLTSHLLSAFSQFSVRRQQQHQQQWSYGSSTSTALVATQNDGYSPNELASSLPQSIHAANGNALSLAVEAASAHLANEGSGNSTNGSTRVGRPGTSYATASAVEVMKTKLDTHNSFINFLLRAGIYKKVDHVGRMAVRDHGEMIFAIGGMLSSWQEELDLARGKKRDSSLASSVENEENNHDEERTLINKALIGSEEAVTEFPTRMKMVQQQVLLFDNDNMSENSSFSGWALFQVSNLLCTALQYALDYRESQSGILYDLPSNPGRWGWGDYSISTLGTSEAYSPWTSGKDVLSVLEKQLDFIEKGGSDLIIEEFGSLVEIMVISLLDGYRDITPSLRDEGQYDAVKDFAISLVQSYSPIMPSNDPYQDLAFELSLGHGYFEGVVRICHDYNVSRSEFDNDVSDDEHVSKYDLKAMLSPSTASNFDETNPHAGLYISSDFKTGLSFPKFVLKWYADRKLFGSVLELGRNCPQILSQYLEEDSRLSDLRWIQYVRTDQFENASSCLANLIPGGSTMLGGKADERQTLEDMQLVLSLAKLSNMISVEDDQIRKEKEKFIDNNLELCKAQEILSAMDPRIASHNKPMMADDLMRISLTQNHATQSTEDKTRLCLVGLTIANIIEPGDQSVAVDDKTRNAAMVWATSIDSDTDQWVEMLQDWNEMSDEERMSRACNTVFYSVARSYYEHMTDKNDTIGFNNKKVESQTLEMCGINHEGFRELLHSVLQVATSND